MGKLGVRTVTEISKILSSRQDVAQTLTAMLSALDKQFPENVAQFSLGNTCAHYSTDIAEMEGLSRALWGLFPLLAGGAEVPFSDKYLTAIKLGTDPQSPSYWGKPGRTISVWLRWRPTALALLCCRTS